MIGWLQSGNQLAKGRSTALPEPGEHAYREARQLANKLEQRIGVQRIGCAELAAFEDEADVRTLYRFDVRATVEYEAGHLPGWRCAPGGQLIHVAEDYAATRNARVVLADWDGVRAINAAAWLMQLGGKEIYLYRPPLIKDLEIGPEPIRVLATQPAVPGMTSLDLNALLDRGAVVVFDVDRRHAFEKHHFRGAWSTCLTAFPSLSHAIQQT